MERTQEYYMMLNGERIGPLSIEQMERMPIEVKSQVQLKGMVMWENAGDVPALARIIARRLANK